MIVSEEHKAELREVVTNSNLKSWYSIKMKDGTEYDVECLEKDDKSGFDYYIYEAYRFDVYQDIYDCDILEFS